MHTYISPAQFEFIKPFFPLVKTTRPKKYSDYDLLNGLLHLLRTGSQWRNIPSEYPPWKSIYWFWVKLQAFGSLDKIIETVYQNLHTRDTPLYTKYVLVTDSQSIDSTECLAKEQKGYDGNKKRNGLKRFTMCDSKGHIQSVFCTTANCDEKKTLRSYLLNNSTILPWNRLTLMADKGFESGKLQRELFTKLNLSFAPMRRRKKYKVSQYTKDLIEQEEIRRKDYNNWIKKMRYIVELTFSWLNRWRRLTKCFERSIYCHTNLCKLASIMIGLKRF
jgi:putative transposase